MSVLKQGKTAERLGAANGRNAVQSTGPRPSEGKRRVRANAWKHGRRARTSAEDLLERLRRGRAQGGDDQKKSV